jgi:hypothetical protein
MAIGLYFTPSSFTPERYDSTIKRLEEAGAGAPPGRLHHVALESGGLIQVFDLWDSEEAELPQPPRDPGGRRSVKAVRILGVPGTLPR